MIDLINVRISKKQIVGKPRGCAGPGPAWTAESLVLNCIFELVRGAAKLNKIYVTVNVRKTLYINYNFYLFYKMQTSKI